MTPDGRYVVFTSSADNLTTEHSANHRQVYLRDRQDGTTTLVSQTPTGEASNGDAGEARISDNGQYIAFTSEATNLVSSPVAPRQTFQIYLRDNALGTTQMVSIAEDGSAANWDGVWCLEISPDGKSIFFSSYDSVIVPNTPNLSEKNRVCNAFLTRLR
jgi:Tol biopolymer transport system component